MNPDKCDHCGLCRQECVVFAELRRETASPRSQLQYAKNNMMLPMILNCTFCNACVRACPYEIDIPKSIRTIREEMVRNGMETKAGRAMIENIRKNGTPYQE